jgi:nucleotide-sensitive chloride channel 1A
MVDLKAFAQRLGLDWDVSLTESKQPVLNSADNEQLSCSYSNVELAVGDPGSSAGTGSVFVTTR